MKTLRLFLLLSFFSFSLNAQVPDFTYTDLNGNSHSLYADYLDQGIPVVIIVSAAWGPWDILWHESGYMESFYQNYGTGTNPDVAVLHIEPNPTTIDDDLYGTTGNSSGDFVTGTSYPIINVTDNSFMDNFEVAYFPSMVVVCPDGTGYCDYAQTATLNEDPLLIYTELQNNPTGLEERLFENCGTTFNRSILEGFVYDDDNDDCIADSGEEGLPGFLAHITGPNSDIYRYSNSEGIFKNLLDSGTYQVNVTVPNNYWSVCNSSQTVEVTNVIDTFELDFGAQSVVDCPYGVIDITSPALVRCFESGIYVGYCNEGTVSADDASVEVTLDPFLNFVSSIPAPSTQNGDVLTYDLGNVGIGECGDIFITVDVSCDSDTGQVHCFSAQFYPDTTCVPSLVSNDSYAEECQANVGSWDPNDKRAFPEGIGLTNDILPNTELKYQIRFQNEGTWAANKVVIEDELPEELDISKFRLGTYSHSCEVELEGRLLRVTFEDINLPFVDDDEPGSHGFVNFYISQNPDLANGTQIWNDAAIYFDFNEPVITNNHLYTINDGLVNNNNISKLGFAIQPNPAQNVVHVFRSTGFEEGTVQVQLLGLNGQVIKEQILTGKQMSLSLNEIGSGMYYVQLIGEDGKKGVQKLVVYK